MIGFLDESVLNSKDPTFADWARRPLQEEMFGGHFAGEYFFRNLTELLNRPESAEVADVLELHALCLLLGYRGRFAFGDASEIHTILQRIREKITRIRGNYALFRPVETPAAPPAPKGDPWVGPLAIAAILLAVFTILAYVGYIFILGQALPTASQLIRPNGPTPNPVILSEAHLSGVEGPASSLLQCPSTLSGLEEPASSPKRTSL
jgi:type VI secretion system protein ImpK